MRFCPRCGTRFDAAAFCPEDGERTQELPTEDPSHALVGQVIDGRYRIEEPIGEGGMGIVYRATHIALNKTLALKIMREDLAKEPAVVQRFIQEAQSATSIGHQNIIDISDFGRLPQGAVYFVMEFLDGQSLGKLIGRGGPVPVGTAVRIVGQIASALGAAHAQGIVHRDLKPDNIFLIVRGQQEYFVKVLDFGIAKVIGGSNKLTQTGTVFGTPHYMSPEQAAGQGVDHRTDIYALGVIMYELFTGHVPFDADTFMGVLTKHMFEEPAPMMRSGDQRLLGALELVTFTALAKKPENRYQSMGELAADLQRAMGGDALRASSPMPPPSDALADNLEPRSISEMNLDQRLRGKTGASRAVSGRLMGVGAVALLLVAAAVVFAVSRGESPPAESARELRSPDGSTPSVAPARAGEAADQPPSIEAYAEPPAPEPRVAPAPAIVEVVSDPEGAAVVMDGAILGSTPVKLPKPTAGQTREITLQLEGYRDRVIELREASPEQLRVTLLRGRPGGTARQPARVRRAPAEQARPRTDVAPRTQRPSNRWDRSEVIDPWD